MYPAQLTNGKLQPQRVPKIRQVGSTNLCTVSYPKSEVPSHVHSAPRFSFILQGHTVEIDDRQRKTHAGPLTMVYQPAGREHSHIIETELALMRFELSPELLTRFSDFAPDLERPMVVGSAPVVLAALRLHREMWIEDSASPLVMEALIVELVARCVRCRLPQTDTTPPRWLRKARELVQNRFRERLSLSEIAFSVGIHPSHLSRMFRAQYGETVGDFARRLRLEEGVRQLEATNLTIGEIATNSGFCDGAQFSNACRRVLGASPVDIRRSL